MPLSRFNTGLPLSSKGGEGAFSVSRLLGGRACGRQQKKQTKYTDHEKMQFWDTTEHERGLTRTPHGAIKGTKARTCTEKTLHAIPRYTIVHLMQMSDSAPSVLCTNAYGCVSSSLHCGGV